MTEPRVAWAALHSASSSRPCVERTFARLERSDSSELCFCETTTSPFATIRNHLTNRKAVTSHRTPKDFENGYAMCWIPDVDLVCERS